MWICLIGSNMICQLSPNQQIKGSNFNKTTIAPLLFFCFIYLYYLNFKVFFPGIISSLPETFIILFKHIWTIFLLTIKNKSYSKLRFFIIDMYWEACIIRAFIMLIYEQFRFSFGIYTYVTVLSMDVNWYE